MTTLRTATGYEREQAIEMMSLDMAAYHRGRPEWPVLASDDAFPGCTALYYATPKSDRPAEMTSGGWIGNLR